MKSAKALTPTVSGGPALGRHVCRTRMLLKTGAALGSGISVLWSTIGVLSCSVNPLKPRVLHRVLSTESEPVRFREVADGILPATDR